MGAILISICSDSISILVKQKRETEPFITDKNSFQDKPSIHLCAILIPWHGDLPCGSGWN